MGSLAQLPRWMAIHYPAPSRSKGRPCLQAVARRTRYEQIGAPWLDSESFDEANEGQLFRRAV